MFKNLKLKNSLKISNFKLEILSICLLGYLLIGLFPAEASASEYAVSAYPPLIKIRTTGAVTVKSPIVITNPTDNVENFKISFRPFTQSDKNNGQVRFIKSNELDLKDPLIFQRIKIFDGDTEINTVQLSPKERKELSIHIDIPPAETISDYYFSIIFTSTPYSSRDYTGSTNSNTGEQKNKSDILMAAAINVLLSISDGSKPQVEISDLSTSFFNNKGPINFRIEVNNEGNKFEDVHGFLTIKDIFGHIVGRIELKHVNILSRTSRLLTSGDPIYAVWPEAFVLGPYTANLSLIIGEDEQVLTKTTYFIGTPIQFTTTGLMIIILLIIIGKKLKSRSKHK